MRKYIFIVTSLLFLSSYSQSRKNTYFLIDRNDTLIKKQIANQTNEYEGYRIIDERRIVTDIKRSESIDGDDITYETFASYSFSFNRKEDTIISKTYFDSLSIIKDRRKFLDTIKTIDKSVFGAKERAWKEKYSIPIPDSEINEYLEKKQKKLELEYILWGCACPNWIEREKRIWCDKNKESYSKFCFYIEPADTLNQYEIETHFVESSRQVAISEHQRQENRGNFRQTQNLRKKKVI